MKPCGVTNVFNIHGVCQHTVQDYVRRSGNHEFPPV